LASDPSLCCSLCFKDGGYANNPTFRSAVLFLHPGILPPGGWRIILRRVLGKIRMPLILRILRRRGGMRFVRVDQRLIRLRRERGIVEGRKLVALNLMLRWLVRG